jgi:hypothetical protein
MPIQLQAPCNELMVEAHRLLAISRVDGADIPWASCRSRDETLA